MIAHAIGPQNVERVSGIIARIAASAVSEIGRRRRTADSTIASHSEQPRARSLSICAIRITELRRIMPNSAITPEHRDEAERHAEDAEDRRDADESERTGGEHQRGLLHVAQLHHQQHEDQRRARPARPP